MKRIVLFAWGMAMLSAAATAEAAVCTTNVGTGTWNTPATWSCGHVPVAADTVVISRAITLSANSTIAGLTVNAGVTFSGNNRNLTVNGPVLISGTYNTGGGDLTTTGGGALTIDAGGTFNFNNGNTSISGNVVVNGTLTSGGDAIQMTGAGTTVSGTGTIDNTDFEIDALGISLPAGSTLEFSNGAQLRVGNNNTASFTLDGTITGFGLAAGDRLVRVYQNSGMTINGTINAPNAYIRMEQNAAITNNGTVSVQYLRTDAVTSVWTQGNNSNLTLSVTAPAGNWNGVLNASATSNTVTYNGTSTVIAPSAPGYWNLAGTIFPGVCPVAYTVSGTNPCPAGSGSIISSPSTCTTVVGAGATIAWTNPANAYTNDNVLYATAGLVNGQTTDYLNCTGFSFAGVPSGATITGITVYVDRKASRTNRIRDAFVYMIKGGVISTAVNGATATSYTTADVNEAHGGAGNLWGTTWTPADVTAGNFGVAFAATNYSTNTATRTVSVDHIQVKVDYTSAVLHHVSISAPAAAMSLTEVPVAIAPHTSAHGAITAAGTLNLSTSTGTGDWTIGTGTGTLTPGAANSGLATYIFGAAESSATLGFTAQSAGTVTLNVANNSGGADMLLNTPVGEKANVITFSSASFVFTNSACTHNVAFGTAGQCAVVAWSPRIAGQALANVYITSVNAAGVPTRLHPTQVRTRTMQFGLSCHDPVANAGVQATFSATAVALPLCQANGATPATWTAATTLSFPGGSPSVGPYSFNYDDVGKVEMWMRNSAATTELGSSGVFVVKPAGFTLSNIIRTSDSVANPGAANAAGAAFVKAGEAFTMSVTAVNAAAVATPNYGKEVTPESVKLTPSLVAGLGLTINPAIRHRRTGSITAGSTSLTVNELPDFSAGDRIVVIGAGAAGANLGTTVASAPSGNTITLASAASTTVSNVTVKHGFAGGVATESDFAWDEVGIITLTPSVGDADYLGAGDVSGTTSGNVGRFSLGKFALQGVTLDNRADLCREGLLVLGGAPCAPVFTYMGEQIDANFTLVPKSLNGTVVQNYRDSAIATNDFAKLDPTTFANLNLGAVDTVSSGAPHYLTARISNSALSAASCLTPPCFQSASATVNVPFMLTRGASADGVFGTTNIGIALADSDGARVEGLGATAGLCNNPNAVDCYDLNSDASAGNDRALLGTTELRYGRSKVSNAYGSELLPLRMDVRLEYWSGSYYTPNVDDDLSVIAAVLGSYTGNLSSGETILTAPTFVNGVGQIGLSAPGAGNSGSVGVTLNPPSYLPGDAARATFGVYKGANEFIYLREVH